MRIEKMRILVSKYWTTFKKTIINEDGKKKTVKDGKKFEELIKNILDLEYGKNRWQDTGETWDGSRDFEWRTPDSYKWAECKNYSSNISLNVISNTLIMAMIDFADEILIFSYSKIKEPALKKLIQFADISQKTLKIYADESLEEIILVHMTELKDIFFADFPLDAIANQFLPPYISCNILSDPVTAYNMDMDLGYIPRKPSKINFDSILCLSILIYNQSAKNISITIELNWEKSKNCFRVLNPKEEKIICFELSANTTIIKKIYFETIIYKDKLNYPRVVVSNSDFQKEYTFGFTKCSWIGECVLQGSSYKKIKGDFQAKILNPYFFRGINIYGTSGTGKSRLLKECENIALGNGYRVIRFGINKKNNTKNFLQKIIMEFICALYDIPNMEEYIQESDSGTLNNIYKMLLTIKSSQIEQQYLSTTVIPIASRKLMQTRCYISFDNLQYYPDQFIMFLNDLVENLLLTNQHCKSRMGFSFNTDYIYNQDECMHFYSYLISNKDHLQNIKLEGFSTDGEARVFFNQLLPNANVDTFYIDKIMNAANKNPFYIKSYLVQLEIEGILTKRDDYYIIPSYKHSEFKKKMSHIPENIRETVKIRWEYYLSKHEESSSVKILSLLHIFQYLNNELIEEFSLSKSIINTLCEYHFLKFSEENEIIYFFEHDLTEKYFSQAYFPLCKYAFISVPSSLRIDNYWYSRLADIVYNRSIKLDTYKNLITKEIPYKIGYEFYTLLLKYLLTHIHILNDLKNYLEILTTICSNTRELYGTEASITLYKKIVEKITTDFAEYQADKNWAWTMISYCNLLYEHNQYNEAIDNINNLLSYWPEENICPDNAIIFGYLYNRLHVYHRAMEFQVTTKSLYWLEKSEGLKKFVEHPELLFLNLIDRGYCNYDCFSSQKKILQYWEKACRIYENNVIITKKPNYYYAKICVQLLTGNLENALVTINKGIRAIETKEEGTYYYTYFKQRYLLCLIACSLLKPHIKNTNQIIEYFNEAEDLNYILRGRMGYSIHWLKSILSFFTNQYLDSILCIQSAIDIFLQSQRKTFRDIYLTQLCDNAKYFMAKAMIDIDFTINLKQLNNRMLIQGLRKIIRMSNSERLNFVSAHEATGVLQTTDHKINFPVL